MRADYNYFDHGHQFGFADAKAGDPRKCPYLPEFTEAIRGWYQGWDDYWQIQKKLTQMENPE